MVFFFIFGLWNSKVSLCATNIFSLSLGYSDIGSVWREESNSPNLQGTIDSLMQEIKPFYQLLHGILRNVLWKNIHKIEPFDRNSTIPAHILGRIRIFFLEIFSFQQMII